MPALARKSDWYKQLRQTRGPEKLRDCKPDEFPLDEVHPLSNPLLNSSTNARFGLKPIVPRSNDADQFLITQLALLKNEPMPEPYVLETAVIACLHLFSYEAARAYIRRWTRPDFISGTTHESFKSRISFYLQSIIIAHKVDICLVHEGEVLAARQLLPIVHHVFVHDDANTELPPIIKLLSTLAHTNCEELFPPDLVSEILSRTQYKDHLHAKLTELQRSYRWIEAYATVKGLRELCQQADLPQSVRSLLPHVFFNYPMWAAWRPNLARIEDWELKVEPFQQSQLGIVFALEGPDTTPQQRALLRYSDVGAFTNCRAEPPPKAGKDILDKLLNLLDDAIAIGPRAIDLFIHLCVRTSSTLRWRTLRQLSLGLSLRHEPAAQTLCDFLRSMEHEVSIRDRMMILTDTLPLFLSSGPLQKAFGHANDLTIRAPKALSEAQKHFCSLLIKRVSIAESFGLEVRSLGLALLHSNWMHSRWKPAFLQMLQTLPSEDEISGRFHSINTAKDPLIVQAHMDALAITLGASEVIGPAAPCPPPPVTAVTVEEPIWRAPLDPKRDALRKILQNMEGVRFSHATACLRAATKEYDAFVVEIVNNICSSTDQACVNLAKFLGRQVATNGKDSVTECWKSLLLQIMRQRPDGLVERLAKALPAESWNSWMENMSLVLGTRHLGKDGVSGFTEERLRQLTQWKNGLMRGDSTSTGSTFSSWSR
ncbi:hypothetical protein QBC38DRAFT_394966 [Podospora fimiseda]|uniref:Uncharacterized protein n=1 Tax=Podospora fimiseda TaxID=252190 RepID=A0AAN7BLS7_9PEZI|nr:hypothetical protein QBC38DRAFT_394966 [Podospora fimiseda]